MDEIARLGVPPVARLDLAHRADGAVALTLKGHQYYRAACERWGLAWDLGAVRDEHALFGLEDALLAAAIAGHGGELAELVACGASPQGMTPTLRAYLHGTAATWRSAVARRQALAAAGPPGGSRDNAGLAEHATATAGVNNKFDVQSLEPVDC